MTNVKFKELEKNKQIEITKLLKERIKKVSDINTLAKFFWERPKVDIKLFGENYKEHLKKAIEGIGEKRDMMDVVKENSFKTGDFFMSLRIAITGMKFTPPINESVEILGKEETLIRIKKLI